MKQNPQMNPMKRRRPLASRRKVDVRLCQPQLRFTPTAWAKLLFLRDYGETEVGGFGISARDDLLLVDEVQLVKQTCTWAHVAFDDVSVADYFDRQIDAGKRPDQCGRIWIHTHPGDSAEPSQIDEATFSRVFGQTDWAIMFILARGGQTSARLRFHTGPQAEIELPVRVDYSQPFEASNPGMWEQEYLAHVQPEHPLRARARDLRRDLAAPVEDLVAAWDSRWDEFPDEFHEFADFPSECPP